MKPTNEATHPYLAIKNWAKYQSSLKQPTMSWIKDYSDQTVDTEYARLTIFQRAVLQECRRLRGRLGANIPNDAAFIGRAACVLPEERRLIPRTLGTLIARGFLVPTL